MRPADPSRSAFHFCRVPWFLQHCFEGSSGAGGGTVTVGSFAALNRAQFSVRHKNITGSTEIFTAVIVCADVGIRIIVRWSRVGRWMDDISKRVWRWFDARTEKFDRVRWVAAGLLLCLLLLLSAINQPRFITPVCQQRYTITSVCLCVCVRAG